MQKLHLSKSLYISILVKTCMVLVMHRNEIIMRVWKFSSTGQKAVTIPKHCNIKAGDLVKIEKVIEDVPQSDQSDEI